MEEISFLRGVPAEEALEEVAGLVAKNYAEALRLYGPKILQYQTPGVADFNGFIPLKKTLAERLGVEGDPNRRVVCFNGGMEVLSLLMKAYPRGSAVAMEALTYDRALADAQRYEHEVVGVPFAEGGIDLEALEKILSQGKIRLFYRIIYHQNPTGFDSTSENIEAAAEICARYGTLYVCDIAYWELRYDGRPNPLPDLKKYPETCLIGSFTKTLSPGTKCGFGVFPEKTVEQLAPVIANTRLNPNYPTQAMIHLAIASGEYDQYLAYLRRLYLPRMEALNKALSEHLGGLNVPAVTGGFFVGIWLPAIADEAAFIAAAKAEGVNIAPANVFAPGWKEIFQERYRGPYFRLTFPALKPEKITQGITAIGAAYRKTLK